MFSNSVRIQLQIEMFFSCFKNYQYYESRDPLSERLTENKTYLNDFQENPTKIDFNLK